MLRNIKYVYEVTFSQADIYTHTCTQGIRLYKIYNRGIEIDCFPDHPSGRTIDEMDPMSTNVTVCPGYVHKGYSIFKFLWTYLVPNITDLIICIYGDFISQQSQCLDDKVPVLVSCFVLV